MPVYRRTYRSWTGEPRRWFRWLIVAEQELRILSKARLFKLLILAALLHCILRLMQVVAYDIIMQDPNNVLTPVLIHVQGIMVNEGMFFDFIWLQATLVFLLSLYSGSGMVCNDFKNNLMEVYFSKPLRWRDYVTGKVMSIAIPGLLVTAVPGILLVILHNLLAPGWDLFWKSLYWPVEITVFSLLIILPCATAIPACSALVRSRNLAAIFVFMVLVVNSTLSVVLTGVLENNNWLMLSYPASVYRVGQEIFGKPQVHLQTPWTWSLCYVIAVCGLSLLVLSLKVRRSEVAG